jgi:hypothetical protein
MYGYTESQELRYLFINITETPLTRKSFDSNSYKNLALNKGINKEFVKSTWEKELIQEKILFQFFSMVARHDIENDKNAYSLLIIKYSKFISLKINKFNWIKSRSDFIKNIKWNEKS